MQGVARLGEVEGGRLALAIGKADFLAGVLEKIDGRIGIERVGEKKSEVIPRTSLGADGPGDLGFCLLTSKF